MKKLGLVLLSLFTFSTYADCTSVYQMKLSDTLEEIERKKTDENVVVKTMREKPAVGISAGASAFVGGAFTGIEVGNAIGTTIAGSGGPGVSTVAAVGAMVVMGVSAKILDLLADKEIEELELSARATKLSLQLLRESKIGDGETLRVALQAAITSGNTDASISSISEKVNELSSQNEFCSTTPLDNLETMIKKIVLAL